MQEMTLTVMMNMTFSATLTLNASSSMTISEGHLPATYKLEQLHFHWGASKGSGSEHALDGDLYDAEVNSKVHDGHEIHTVHPI